MEQAQSKGREEMESKEHYRGAPELSSEEHRTLGGLGRHRAEDKVPKPNFRWHRSVHQPLEFRVRHSWSGGEKQRAPKSSEEAPELSVGALE